MGRTSKYSKVKTTAVKEQTLDPVWNERVCFGSVTAPRPPPSPRASDTHYSFRSVLRNLDSQENVPGIENLAGPGGWCDLDMLMFANPRAKLSSAKAATHLALWAAPCRSHARRTVGISVTRPPLSG